MKKKIISLCLVVVLALTAIGGATLAYFTDTDEADNTFTVGKVSIELIEQQRGVDEKSGNTILEAFEDGKPLMPIVGSAQGEKDTFGLPTAKNYVDKIVTVKNLEEDAYVRAYMAIPAALQAADSTNDPLHFNWGNKFTATGNYDTTANPQPQSADYQENMGDWVEHGTTTMDGVVYNVYSLTYRKVLAKNEVTGSAFVTGFYLDSRVNTRYDAQNKKTVYTMTVNGTTSDIDYDFSNGVTIPVFAVGVQATGFEDVKDDAGAVTKCAADVAIDSAFGENYSPWTLNS